MLQNHGGTSGGNSPVSAAPKQNQRREAGGRLIRSILLHSEARQSQTSTPIHTQQKSSSSENVKRLPRGSNARSNGHVSHNELNSNFEGDRKRASDDKFAKKDPHGMSNVSEKQEKRTRNKDRPDRGVWTLRRGDVSHATDERVSSSVSQPSQLLSDTSEGTDFTVHGIAVSEYIGPLWRHPFGIKSLLLHYYYTLSIVKTTNFVTWCFKF